MSIYLKWYIYLFISQLFWINVNCIPFPIYSFSPRLQMIPIVITLVTNEGGSEELLEEVEEEMRRLGMQLNIDITINEVDRFGMKRYSDT